MINFTKECVIIDVLFTNELKLERPDYRTTRRGMKMVKYKSAPTNLGFSALFKSNVIKPIFGHPTTALEY